MNAVVNRGYISALTYNSANQSLKSINFRGEDPEDMDSVGDINEFDDEDQDTIEISSKKAEEDEAEPEKETKVSADDSKPSKKSAKKSTVKKDRDFNVDKAISNFGKGFISPITTMFSSATNFVIGAGAVGICAALLKATKNQIGVLLVAGGTIYGGIQTALGIKKVIIAKNNEARENAFYDIGSGSSILLTSAVFAKPTLEAAGVPAQETEALTITQATVKCFKKIPDAFNKSITVLNDPNALTGVFSSVAASKDVSGKVKAQVKTTDSAASSSSENTCEISKLGQVNTKNTSPLVASTEDSKGNSDI